MTAGPLRKRVVFERQTVTSDGGGGGSVTWSTLLTAWGGFAPQRGRERINNGRLAESVAGVLTVRSSSDSRGVTSADRVKIDGVPYQIHSITNPDQRNQYLEMTVERGAAT